MHIINITVRNKIAVNPAQDRYVCGNSDFVVHFDFDSEWDAYENKTARFIKEDGSYVDQLFSGNDCPVPVISDTYKMHVGVFAGNLSTTTAAYVPAKKSILCGGGAPADPAPDVYNQIMELLNKGGGGDSLPETSDPLKQLVTDADGKVAWEDRLAYKYTTESTVVNLPPTNLLGIDNDDTPETAEYFALTTPWLVGIEDGKTYDVVYNGKTYACPAIKIEEDGGTGYVLGNTDPAGISLPGSNPNAPLMLICFPAPMEGPNGENVIAQLAVWDNATSVTLAVSQAGTTTVKPIDPELMGLETIDIIVAEDGTVSCDFPFERAWAMDDRLLAASIRVKTREAKYTYYTYRQWANGCTVTREERVGKNGEDSEHYRGIRIVVPSAIDPDLSNTNVHETRFSWLKASYNGESLEAITKDSVLGIPIARKTGTTGYSPDYETMRAMMGFPANVKAGEYLRFDGSKWVAVTIDQLKADLGLT